MNPTHEPQDCTVQPLEKPINSEALRKATVAYLVVGGMGCPRCATRVRNGLLALEGALMVEVFLRDGLAIVAFEPSQVSPTVLVDAIEGASNDHHRYQAEVLSQQQAKEALVQLGDTWVWH